jgi:predicted CXXCH cytochrome family protein
MKGRLLFRMLGVALWSALVFGAAPGAAAKGKQPSSLKTLAPSKPLPEGAAKYSHAPFSQGDCSICHKNKDPQNPGKLTKPARVQCLSCHEYQREQLKRSAFVHTPVKKDCIYCHNAHNSNDRRLLHRPAAALCAACHTDKRGSEQAGVVHDAVVKQRACKNCHVHHASSSPNMLRGSEFALCISCHADKEVLDEQGKRLVDIKTLYETKPVLHGPFARRSCSACHDPHFSKHHRLLKAEYPATFYSAYGDATYKLCFECHDPQRVTQDKTRELTGFRKGEDNLHYVHVVKADPGRTCRACHEDHGTDYVHLVRTSVPYGSAGWLLPLNYRPTASGGSCEKTCHNKETYDNGGVRPTDVAAAYKKKFGSSFPTPPAAKAAKTTKGKDASAKTASAPTPATFSMDESAPGVPDDGMEPTAKAEAHFNFAKRFYKENRLADALVQIRQAIELDDALAEAHALAGIIHAKQKKCDLAEPEFDKALQIDEKNSNAKKGKKLLAKLSKLGKCAPPEAAPPEAGAPVTP